MSQRYLRIRLRTELGTLMLRESVVVCFFLRRSHGEIGPAVARSLESFRQAVKPYRLGWYVDESGEFTRPLDEEAWGNFLQQLLVPRQHGACTLRFEEHRADVGGFRFEYYGLWLDAPFFSVGERVTSSLAFWLPTEYLEERGPEHVRHLALQLADGLPFTFGYASMAVNVPDGSLLTGARFVRPYCMRHPGLDFPMLWSTALKLGTRVRGAYWLTFLGPAVLGPLGGAEGLRAHLKAPGTFVQPLHGERALVTLGEWPELGDTEAGQGLPHYRELAQVLEPWWCDDCNGAIGFSPEDTRRWTRRLLAPGL